ncbi:MAG: 50S ribosomal protein L9 [Marinilabiliales bacterium]|nr:MAG: 50S ribosomal protein L9 [Marinilabiliales bacterium]
MELILKQDIPNIGHKDEIVTVKAGYGRNYLIPQGMATLATERAKKIHSENMRQRAHKEAKLRQDAEGVVKSLEGIKLTIGAKTSSTGKIFGSVTTIQLAEALAQKSVEVERKNIKIIGSAIKEVGNYKANVRIYKDISTEIDFEVISE